MRLAPEDLEPEGGTRAHLGGHGEDEQRRARALRGTGEAVPRAGSSEGRGAGVRIEHDEPEAAGAEQYLGGAECITGTARPHPEGA